MIKTTDRILDTAEQLFAEKGFAATSLRSIMATAGVNLAAVHYHFRSKEALLDSVIMRRAEPVNRKRLEMLEECERAAASGPLPLEKVIEAFILPAFRLAAETERGPLFVRLVARVHTEGELFPDVLKRNFGPVLDRFTGAFARALPEVPPDRLLLGLHFTMGAVVQALRGPKLLEVLSGGQCQFDWQTTSTRLIAYVSAGLRAGADS